jgi:hypothetical protein
MSVYFIAMFKPLNHLILNLLMGHVTRVKPIKYGTLFYKIMIKNYNNNEIKAFKATK